MDFVRFELPLRPKAWERTRQNNGRRYNSKELKEYETAAALAYRARSGGRRFGGAVIVDITACFRRPKRPPRGEQTDSGAPYPKTPDADNIAKAICDGLNKTAYDDDKQVTTLIVKKIYSDRDKVITVVAEDIRN